MEQFHCKECAGLAKSKGEVCFYCDGQGNPKENVSTKYKPSESKKKKKKK